MAEDKKQKIKVLEGDNHPMYKGRAYYEEPSMMEKAKITAKSAATKLYDDVSKAAMFSGRPRKDDIDKAKAKAKPTDDEDFISPDMVDKKQTMLNQRAAENYEATKEYKKGGKVGSASKRADGCCIKGKTRGKML